MEPLTVILIGLALIVCVYMAWNIGANDVANAMGTSLVPCLAQASGNHRRCL